MANILDNVDDWQHAVTTLVDHYTEEDLPFSSGEIAKEIREVRPELNFSVLWIGNFVRDLFYSGSIVYDIHGTSVQTCMVPRRTEGKMRTPEGVEVFVYASDDDSAREHDFEVEIPKPPHAQPGYNGPTPVFVQPPKDDGEWVPDEKVQVKSGHFTVRVHSDSRLCFTRPLMEAFFHKSGNAVKGGDSVYVRKENDMVILTVNEFDGSTAYQLSESRGRVLYPMTLTPGTVYDVEVTSDSITVSL